jgi:hypothetical protein
MENLPVGVVVGNARAASRVTGHARGDIGLENKIAIFIGDTVCLLRLIFDQFFFVWHIGRNRRNVIRRRTRM